MWSIDKESEKCFNSEDQCRHVLNQFVHSEPSAEMFLGRSRRGRRRQRQVMSPSKIELHTTYAHQWYRPHHTDTYLLASPPVEYVALFRPPPIRFREDNAHIIKVSWLLTCAYKGRYTRFHETNGRSPQSRDITILNA